MLAAIGLNLLLGCSWSFLGSLMGRASSGTRSGSAFLSIGTGLVALAGWVFLVDWPLLISGQVPRLWTAVAWTAAAGVTNGLVQLSMVMTMSRGHKGLSWALGQSAMVIPFCAGIFLWNETVGVTGWSGVVALLLAVGLIASRKGGGDGAALLGSPGWLGCAFLTMGLIGVTQLLFSVPSYWPDWDDVASIRLPVNATATCLVHCMVLGLTRQRPDGVCLRMGLLWLCGSFPSFLLLFLTLDRMEAVNLRPIVFPLAVGACMVSFLLYSRFWLCEAFPRRVLVGLSLALVGIVLVATSRLIHPIEDSSTSAGTQSARILATEP